jgi:uncharacterized protein (DUF1800 family)
LAEQVSALQDQVTASVASRFLEQASWGPTPTTIAQVQQSGLQGYLTQQFSAPVSTYKTPGTKDDLTFVQKQFFVSATQGQDQLRQRVSFALSQIMVISAFKIGDPTAFSLWMNMMQNDAFGNFSALLKDVTLSPSMGLYLDIGNNDGCNGCSPNENYGREVMQLFSIGVMQLNPDGTPQLDSSGNTIPTYTQNTIEGFAHTFTGWSYPPAPGSQAQFYASPYFSGPMLPYDSHHDKGSKLLLNGVTLPAGGTIQADLDAALQNIFNHPNVGPFISKQLIQKLVTSNPSPDYVTRIAQTFNDNGSGGARRPESGGQRHSHGSRSAAWRRSGAGAVHRRTPSRTAVAHDGGNARPQHHDRRGEPDVVRQQHRAATVRSDYRIQFLSSQLPDSGHATAGAGIQDPEFEHRRGPHQLRERSGVWQRQ